MKKLLISATLIAAALGSGAIFAAQGEHDHGGPGTTAGAGCPMMGGQSEHAGHGQGSGPQGQQRMAQGHGQMGMGMHGGMQRGARGQGGEHAGHGAQQGNAGAGCPMHGQAKAAS